MTEQRAELPQKDLDLLQPEFTELKLQEDAISEVGGTYEEGFSLSISVFDVSLHIGSGVGILREERQSVERILDRFHALEMIGGRRNV